MLVTIMGKSGSGKSLVAKTLAELGNGVYLDIDKIGHEVVEREEIISQLQQKFNLHLTKEGKINRNELGQKVFSAEEQMEVLREITWPEMEQEIDNQINRNKDKLIILDWIRIKETKYFQESKLKILVDAPFEIRLKRAIKRDKISELKFLEREKAAPEIKETDYDSIIMNIKGKLEVREQVRKIYEQSIVSR